MSNQNAFEAPSSHYLSATEAEEPLKVSISPIEILTRGKDLIGEQYWLFVGITLVGMVIASVVPFGIVAGPIMVGIYLCMLERERGRTVEFGMLFNGFDKFVDSFLVVLITMAISIIVFLPAVLLLGILAAIANNIEPALTGVVVLLWIPFVLVLAFLVYLPSFFAYQLIADRGVSAIDAVKLSFKAGWRNVIGLLFFSIINALIGFVASLICVFPVILYYPIMFAGMFVLYRDIFPGQSIVSNQAY